MGKCYTPKTGVKCDCRKGQQRDNCPNCEGTGYVIDFRAIHARRKMEEIRNQCGRCKHLTTSFSGGHCHYWGCNCAEVIECAEYDEEEQRT